MPRRALATIPPWAQGAPDATLSSFTEADQEAGDVIWTTLRADVGLPVVVSGEVPSDEQIRIQVTGYPGSSADSASVSWTDNPALSKFGHDAPSLLQAHEPLTVIGVTGTIEHISATATPTRPVVVTADNAGVIRAHYHLGVAVGWATTTITTLSSSTNHPLQVWYCSDGVLRLWIVTAQSTASPTLWNVALWESYDSGANWTEVEARCVANPPTSNAPYRLTGGEQNGHVMLTAGYISGGLAYRLTRLYGAGFGARLTAREEDSSFNPEFPYTIPYRGSWITAYELSNTPVGDHTVNISITGHESQNVGDGEIVEVFSGGASSAEPVMVVADDDGALWIYDLTPEGTYLSRDGGSSWSLAVEAIDHWLGNAWAIPNMYAANPISVTLWRGHVLIAGAPSTDKDQPWAWYLGAWQDATLPTDNSGYAPVGSQLSYLGWQVMWLPASTAASQGWTLTSAGAPSAAIAAGIGPIRLHETITISAAGETYYYTGGGLAIIGDGNLVVEWELEDVSSVLLNGVLASVRATCALTVGGPAVVQVDVNRAGFVTITGSGAPVVAAGGIQGTYRLLADAQEGIARLYFSTARNLEPRRWELLGSVAIVSGTPALGWVLDWGQIGVSASAGSQSWSRFSLSSSGTFTPIAPAIAKRPGKRVPSLGAMDLGNGVKLSACSGIGYSGDIGTLQASSPWKAEHISPVEYPTPRIPWRSVDTSSAARFAWRVGDLAANGLLESTLLAVPISGANFRTFYLQGWNGAAWTTLATGDLASGRTALPFTRTGNTVRCTVGASHLSPLYIETDELVGHTVKLDDGAGNVVYRRVASNSGGWWTDDTSRPRVRITLAGALGADPASGTCEIWSPAGILLAVLADLSSYQALAITIPSQTTADGYFELGLAAVCDLHILDWSWGAGRVVEGSDGAALEETPDRALWPRDEAPYRRTVLVDWQGDPIPQGDLDDEQSPVSPWDPSTTAGIGVAGVAHDAISRVQAILREGNGRVPISWIPRCPDFPPDTPTLIRLRERGFWALAQGQSTAETEANPETPDSPRAIRHEQISMVELV